MRPGLLALPLLLPGLAAAEGARLALDCTVTTICDAAGACAAADAPAAFVLAPVETGPDRSGTYALTLPSGDEVLADGAGLLGPHLWQDGTATRSSLTITSPTSALWVAQHLASPGGATIRFLTCEPVQ